jgi:hypothetical protein
LWPPLLATYTFITCVAYAYLKTLNTWH